jgi:AcrR family transcriptional regulator
MAIADPTAPASRTAAGASLAAPPRETRERLLAAALAVFERDGFGGARVGEIAREAGLTTGAIYSQYRGKADLLLDAITTRTRVEVDALLELASGDEARAVLAELGLRLATRHDREPALLVDVFSAARRDAELADHVRATLARREQILVDLVERAREAGEVAPDLDARAIARFCTALAIGTLTLRNVEMPPIDTTAWTQLLARLLDAVAPDQGDDQ